MQRTFTARVWKEGKWFIAQCAQVDVASHGRTENEAIAYLGEAVELLFKPATVELMPKVAKVRTRVGSLGLVRFGVTVRQPASRKLANAVLMRSFSKRRRKDHAS